MKAKLVNEDERLRKWTFDEEKRTRSNSIISSGNLYKVSKSNLDEYKPLKSPIQKQIKPKIKYLTKREYDQILRGAIKDLKNNSGLEVENEDEFDYYSFMDDMADSMLYDQDLYNYLYKKYKREFDSYSNPTRSDLKDILVNDLSSF